MHDWSSSHFTSSFVALLIALFCGDQPVCTLSFLPPLGEFSSTIEHLLHLVISCLLSAEGSSFCIETFFKPIARSLKAALLSPCLATRTSTLPSWPSRLKGILRAASETVFLFSALFNFFFQTTTFHPSEGQGGNKSGYCAESARWLGRH